MPPPTTRSHGDAAEKIAADYLSSKGLKTLARNFHTRWGEIDLVMEQGEQIVFVEVRYRSTAFFGGAAASVTMTKQSKLVRAASRFLQQHRLAHRPVRFDIVAVQGQEHGIEWIVDAFRPHD